MPMRNLIPWGRFHQAPSRFRDENDPFMTLHREMNRLFDDIFRGFESAPSGSTGRAGWPSVEVTESDKDIRISAELPGLDEKDVEVLMNEGILTIRGEKRSEMEDKGRTFSERYYGRFERRIPLAWEIEEDKVEASFRNGVLTVILPKSAKAAAQVKRIAINTSTDTTRH